MSSTRLLRPGARSLTSLWRAPNAPRYFHATTANRIVHEVKGLESFEELLKKQPKVIVDCWATWCGPCKIISPAFEKHSDAPDNKTIHFAKVDVDAEPDVAGALGVRAMPTFLFFSDGQRVDELVGANPSQLAAKIKNLASA